MRILVYGVVQGVGFRPSVYNIARSLGLTGYCRNNGSNVEIVLDRDHELFISALRKGLPPLASIERIEVRDSSDVDMGDYPEFTILLSQSGSRASVIPADTALCDNCVRELFSKDDRRYHYPFINCTDCGARYSLIADVPYDRPKTSMAPFDMCSECRTEYTNPGNRRFHAQTTACPACGPEFGLYDGDGTLISTDQERCFSEFARRLNAGEIGVMKSWGGMHICCGFDSIARARKLYGRPEKPFAIMMRDIETVEKYAALTENERKILTSHKRPIVLVGKKRSAYGILEDISSGLDTVGMMLPYSPAHLLFFEHFRGDGIVATSANVPGEPICIRNEESFDLGLDIYLLHNRDIVQRVDDTVLRIMDDNTFFIRKSRSFVPDPINVDYNEFILAVGAEDNVTSSVSRSGKIFVSQYIGNTKHYDTLGFLENATDHMIDLLGIEEMDCVVRDLHPRYATRRTADVFRDRYDCDIMEVQHHWAHAASLALDNGIEDPMVVLALDGSGYGPDGTIWGGEVLESSFESYRRIGRLDHIPLLGGDKAIRDVRRLVFAISELTGNETGDHYSDTEKDIFRKMINSSILTSSSGRVLDALSSYFDVCHYRSYDGEPAMKLEKYLAAGAEKYDFEVTTRQEDGCTVIENLPVFERMFGMGEPEGMDFQQKSDLAHSAVSGIFQKMTRVAAEHAMSEGIGYVGLTGGVSYNVPIAMMIRDEMNKYPDLKFVMHDRIPNGDGGISIGQNVIAGTIRDQK